MSAGYNQDDDGADENDDEYCTHHGDHPRYNNIRSLYTRLFARKRDNDEMTKIQIY